jgi:hypothetical protein
MGIPGKRWKLELTRKKVSPMRHIDGSGARPGMIGFSFLGGILAICESAEMDQ